MLNQQTCRGCFLGRVGALGTEVSLLSPSCGAGLPPIQGGRACVDAQRVSLAGDPGWGTLQLWAGGVGSSVTKPQHLTAVFAESNRNGHLLCVKPQLLGRDKN